MHVRNKNVIDKGGAEASGDRFSNVIDKGGAEASDDRFGTEDG